MRSIIVSLQEIRFHYTPLHEPWLLKINQRLYQLPYHLVPDLLKYYKVNLSRIETYFGGDRRAYLSTRHYSLPSNISLEITINDLTSLSVVVGVRQHNPPKPPKETKAKNKINRRGHEYQIKHPKLYWNRYKIGSIIGVGLTLLILILL